MHVYASLLVLLVPAAEARDADANLVYRAEWGKGDDGLDGWQVSARKQARVDPKRGPTLVFGAGSAGSPRIRVQGGRRLRFRYVFSKHGKGILYVTAKHYKGDKPLPGRSYGHTTCLQQQHPPIPDPSPVELGVYTEPEADALDLHFTVRGSADQRVSLSGLTVVDVGPPPRAPATAKELLEDPGFEARRVREAIGPESSYFTGPGWMGWGQRATMVFTDLPPRVHTGKRALVVRTGVTGTHHSGLRYLPALKTAPDAWYDFSVWAKGEGTVSLYALVGGTYGDFFATSGNTEPVLLSPTQWRQVHLVHGTFNPAHKGFSVGVILAGRVFLDDVSVRRVSADVAAQRRWANRRFPKPPEVRQVVPEGQTRSREPVVLDNAHLRVVLSPLGGGHITRIEDKARRVVWQNLSLLKMDFPSQPVRIVWDIPFKTKRSADGHAVTFSHVVTGGEAAPFLDGVRIEQRFRLGPDDRVVKAAYRLTHTGSGMRLPNPTVSCAWSKRTGIARLSAAGKEGALVADKAEVTTRDLVGAWMAASGDTGSLVCGFDVRAVKTGTLDPVRRRLAWSYLRLALPPNGRWHTRAWVASVPLPEIEYADPSAAVQARVTKTDSTCTLALRAASLAGAPVLVRARVTNYGGGQIAASQWTTQARLPFTPPPGRFITVLDVGSPQDARRVELFNDPRAAADTGIHGSAQMRYAPTVPVRVLRLPDVGDRRQTIATRRTVLWAKGLYFQYYPLEAPLRKAGLEVHNLDHANGFPEELEELLAYRGVILSNLGAAHLTPGARAGLAQYVRAGGALLVLGGSLGLGNAMTTGTDLEDLLPATLAGPFDVRPCRGPAQVMRADPSSFLAGLPWRLRPRMFWCHRVEPRPSAAVWVSAARCPILLHRPIGHGQVILFAGTVEGSPAPGQLAAWQWKGWPTLWAHVVARL